MSLALLPDEVKQRIWRHLQAQELCRMECVARCLSRGANADAVWKRHTIALITREQARVAALRPPVECGLQRQNARRDVTAAPAARILARPSASAASLALRSSLAVTTSDSDELVAEDSTFWRLWYRDCYVVRPVADQSYKCVTGRSLTRACASQSIRSFDAASAAFDAAKADVHELKRERSELRDLLQSVKSKNQSEKHARRVHMSCVRWMNRSHRRQTASASLLTAQSTALTKAELSDELQRVESAVSVQSKLLFSLRSQYQKQLHRMTTQLARGVQMLQDLLGS